MYCARCGTPLEASERTCAHCGADLTAVGGIRLTDPRASAAPFAGDSAATASSEDANQAPSRIPAEPETRDEYADYDAPVDPWSIGQSGAAAARDDAQTATGEDRPADQESAGEADTIGGVPVVGGSTQHVPSQPRPAAKPQTMTADDSPAKTDAEARNAQWARMLGVDMAKPAGRTTIALLVLLVALVAMMLLMASFMNLDRILVGKPAAPASTVYVTATPSPEPAESSEPAPAPSTAASTPPPIAVPKTPALGPDAKSCQAGVWATQQTSCEFANAVAASIDTKMSGTAQYVVHSPVTRRDYTVECTAAEGITCVGIDANGVKIWIAA